MLLERCIMGYYSIVVWVYQNLVYRNDPGGAFVKKYHFRSSYDSHSVPLPLLFFLLTSFSVNFLHGPHKITLRVRTNVLAVQPF